MVSEKCCTFKNYVHATDCCEQQKKKMFYS